MEKFEKLIRKKGEQLDSFEPSEGHFERFSRKLEQRNLVWYRRIPYPVRAAVILVLVAIGSILVYEGIRPGGFGTLAVEVRVPQEFGEAKIYYASLIHDKEQEIRSLYASDPEQQAIWETELERMDQLFHSLQQDLEQNPTDERILSAMISHYQIKLEVMGRILDQLKHAKTLQLTYDNHENTEI